MDKRTCAIVTNGNHTDIVLITYSNQTLLIITQFKNLGTFFTINHKPSARDLNSHEDYLPIAHFGADPEEAYIAASYIAHYININRPLLLSIALKDYGIMSLKEIGIAINQIKPW